MTTQNSLKRRIRTRMKKTGESYTAARRSVIGTNDEAWRRLVVPGYDVVGGGAHHDSALAANVLRQAGVTEPATGEPFSETMLIGLAGGIGVMYFVFEYEGHLPMLTLMLRHHPDDFLEGMFDRLGIEHRLHRTTSSAKASATLDAVIGAGRPAVCRVTRGALPYEPREPISGDHYEVAVVAIDGDDALVDDETREPRRVSLEHLAAARAFTKKDKHRLIEIVGSSVGDIDDGIRAAISKTCHNLTEPVMGNNFDANFGFRGLEKLALELRASTKQGWIRRFEEPERLFAVLHRLALGIEYEWGSKAGMRPLYAEFLDEAAARLARPGLAHAAGRFRESALHWDRLAELALPAGVAGLGELGTAIDDVEARRITDVSHPYLGASPVDDMRTAFVDGGGIPADELRLQFDAMASEVDSIAAIERAAVGDIRAAL